MSVDETTRTINEYIDALLRGGDFGAYFADDLDDGTGDLVAGTLILGAQRRGPGLAAVLEDLAATVAEEVRIRRGIEADRAKPRTTARWVTVLTLGVLGVLALDREYIAPYKTPIGQLALLLFLSLYTGCLLWLRGMTRGAPTPRFLPAVSVRRHRDLERADPEASLPPRPRLGTGAVRARRVERERGPRRCSPKGPTPHSPGRGRGDQDGARIRPAPDPSRAGGRFDRQPPPPACCPA